TEKQLKEYGDKISADKKAPIETALQKLKEAHKTQDIGAVDSTLAELNNAWTAASEEMYKASQAQGTPGGDGQTNGQQQQNAQSNAGSDNVTDAEFEEVK
ncbi:MAG TPA: molecular chaperone DnaK, partial [Hanamia sp.]|nr:molecular chaperone DnaK [Hanamia sp.]